MLRMSKRSLFKTCLSAMVLAGMSTTFADNFKLSPFVWDLKMAGRVKLGTRQAHIDRHRPGGIIALEYAKNNWRLFGDFTYSQMHDKLGNALLTSTVTNKFGIVSGALGYQVYQWSLSSSPLYNSIQFEPYAGVRYTFKDTDAKINVLGLETKRSDHHNWADPLIGLNLNYLIDPLWALSIGADIGGTNTTSDYSYQAYGLIKLHSEQFLSHFSAYLGYKIIDQHYIQGHQAEHFDWNVKLKGPVAGVSVSF